MWWLIKTFELLSIFPPTYTHNRMNRQKTFQMIICIHNFLLGIRNSPLVLQHQIHSLLSFFVVVYCCVCVYLCVFVVLGLIKFVLYYEFLIFMLIKWKKYNVRVRWCLMKMLCNKIDCVENMK